MWKTLWIKMKYLVIQMTIFGFEQVQKLFPEVLTTYPQNYSVFSQGFTVDSPHIHTAYNYYLFNKVKL